MSITDPKTTLEELLQAVVNEGASDLHIAAGRQPYVRVDGDLIPLATYEEFEKTDSVNLLKALVGDEKLNQLLDEEELDFATTSSTGVRFRGNAFIQRGTVSIALRIIEKIKPLEELQLPQKLLHFTEQQQGFFLVVGPVGVGKSTTLSTLIEHINTERKEHIVTIENPIEHMFEEKNSIIDQREVGLDTKSFHSGLTSVFRQDIDVIMIGEMRTHETIETAVTAAETGHLVFSTLHTNNAAQTVDRIIDSFPGNQQDQIRAQLAGSLLGIFSQRLLPSMDGGRVPAYELLINTPAVSNIIREGRTHELDTVIETGTEDGMVSLNRSLLELVRAGKVSQETALNYALRPDELEKLM